MGFFLIFRSLCRIAAESLQSVFIHPKEINLFFFFFFFDVLNKFDKILNKNSMYILDSCVCEPEILLI